MKLQIPGPFPDKLSQNLGAAPEDPGCTYFQLFPLRNFASGAKFLKKTWCWSLGEGNMVPTQRTGQGRQSGYKHGRLSSPQGQRWTRSRPWSSPVVNMGGSRLLRGRDGHGHAAPIACLACPVVCAFGGNAIPGKGLEMGGFTTQDQTSPTPGRQFCSCNSASRHLAQGNSQMAGTSLPWSAVYSHDH